MDEKGKAKARMHLYMQTIAEAVILASGHASQLLSLPS